MARASWSRDHIGPEQTLADHAVFGRLGDAADEWVLAAELCLAEEGWYTPVDALVSTFLSSALQDQSGVKRAWKAGLRAIGRALAKRFGSDLATARMNGFCVAGKHKAYGVTGPGLEGCRVQLMDPAAIHIQREERKQAQIAAKAAPTDYRVLELEPELPLSSKYTTELLSLGCASTLLDLQLYPDAKELTESFAMFAAVRAHLPQYLPEDPSVTVVCVGDGVSPRTAALFAFRTKWRCVAIDPLLRVETDDASWKGVHRLEVRADRIEETAPINAQKLLLVCVHAHVGLAQCMSTLSYAQSIGIVVMPCCNFYGVLKREEEPLAEYNDRGVVSPHRLVRVYASGLETSIKVQKVTATKQEQYDEDGLPAAHQGSELSSHQASFQRVAGGPRFGSSRGGSAFVEPHEPQSQFGCCSILTSVREVNGLRD